MTIHLINEEFNAKDTLDLLTKMIHLKIKFHEEKVLNKRNEKVIKSQEVKIQRLQKELFELSASLNLKNKNYKIDGTIKIE
ncbi:MAG: hypothetical protein IPO27_02685 [Bacteroidetes bacterium]|nr:hypothetical protein [Bacteroidota bacterium]